jgi:S-adenosylmethionine-dependent methyltransferase
MKMASTADRERFESGAREYAAYLETPEGRLRIDLAYANLEEFLPRARGSTTLCALDLGCGTGAAGIRLAHRGVHVTLLDSSQAMLEIAKRAAAKEGVTDKVVVCQGDAALVKDLFGASRFDVIFCHNVLEFVEAPISVLRDAAGLLRDAGSMVSILVRNRMGEVLKAALLLGDLAAAEQNLTVRWGQESLYGGKVRLFTAVDLEAMLKPAGLMTVAERGVRVVADYLPPQISRNAEYERIFTLERKLGSRPECLGVARYTHCMASLAGK